MSTARPPARPTASFLSVSLSAAPATRRAIHIQIHTRTHKAVLAVVLRQCGTQTALGRGVGDEIESYLLSSCVCVFVLRLGRARTILYLQGPATFQKAKVFFFFFFVAGKYTRFPTGPAAWFTSIWQVVISQARSFYTTPESLPRDGYVLSPMFRPSLISFFIQRTLNYRYQEYRPSKYLPCTAQCSINSPRGQMNSPKPPLVVTLTPPPPGRVLRACVE